MAEFELIHRCFHEAGIQHSETRIANGDDASVHSIPTGYELVVSTDTALCGRHWPENFPLDDAMDRAVCAALSDLAAMGAKPRWLWSAITLQDAQQAPLLGQGIRRAAQRYGVEIAGGDTTRGQQCAVTITVAGIIPTGFAMRRDQACVGDSVYILGHLGLSSLGLLAWQRGDYDAVDVPCFTHVTPQLAGGQALSKAGIRCCIDVSDGLLQDAGHICVASHCAMQVDVASLPNYHLLKNRLGQGNAIQAMLAGGDDYALLFTAPSPMTLPDIGAVCIGQCVTAESLENQLVTPFFNGVRLPFSGAYGFDHFA